MASLTGNKIKDTYPGLIKTDDNAIVGATEKQITDGEGNAIPMTMGTSGVSFTGGADFTGATVTGLPTGSAGLESGTGTDSMQSAASLTTVAADASGDDSIALGDGARGRLLQGSIALGKSADGHEGGVAIGYEAKGLYGGIGIGCQAEGGFSTSEQVIIGAFSKGCSKPYATTLGACSVVNADNGIALGANTLVSAADAVALGEGVTAAKADTVTVKELETCVAGGGIYLTTPDGTAQPKLTVDNSSNLLIGGNPVGGAGLESGTGTDSMQSAASLTTVAADAAGCNAIAIGNNALASSTSTSNFGSIVIGSDVCAVDAQAIVIGQEACAARLGGIAIGLQAKTLTSNFGLAVGRTACVTGYMAAAFGTGAKATAGGLGCGSTAIGNNASAQAVCSVALGANVVATKVGTTTVNELEVCADGGGIYLTTPDGTAQPKITVDNTCALLVDGSPIGGGAAGLESGTGTDSMQSAASLTTVAANAGGTCAIALGNNALANCPDSIAIGTGACANPLFGTNGSITIGKSATTARGNVVVIGNNSSASDTNSTVIGTCSLGQNNHATVVGYQSCANSCSVAIGNIAQANGASSIALGDGACATGPGSIALGLTAKATDALGGVAIGRLAQNPSRGGVAIGNDARTPSANFAISIGYSARGGGIDSISIGQLANAAQGCSISLGKSSSASAAEAVAIGCGVTAAKACTVTVKALETCVAGEGVIMTTPDGTAQYKITVDNSGNLVSTLVV